MIRDGGVRWRPSHQQSGRLLMLTVAVMASVATVQYWTGAPWWLVLVFGSVAAAGIPALWWLRLRAIHTDQHDQAVEAGVRTAIDTGDLQRVSSVTLGEFGVHRSHVQLPYLERDAQAEVLQLLRSGEPVLLLGHSMVGKSRLGAELLRRHFGHHPLVIPTPPRGLAQLFGAGGTPAGAVIWLDDLERYLGPDHFRVEWLDRAVRAGNVVVATMRASAYEQCQPTRDLRPPQWELLERFRPVWIHQDDDERRRLSSRVGDPKLRAGIARYGVAEYIGGGVIAVERFNTGESQHPLGAAMVRAAADWRRAGLEIVPESVLVALASEYLPPSMRQDTGAQASDALAWAAEMIDQTVSLLEPTPAGWRAFDFIVDHLADQGRPIPDATWEAVVAAAADQLVNVGYAAAVVHERLDVAELAWGRGALTELRRLLADAASKGRQLGRDHGRLTTTARPRRRAARRRTALWRTARRPRSPGSRKRRGDR